MLVAVPLVFQACGGADGSSGDLDAPLPAKRGDDATAPPFKIATPRVRDAHPGDAGGAAKPEASDGG